MLDVGQIEGAFMQGLGYVTIEQMLRSKNTGELLSVGPGNYKVGKQYDANQRKIKKYKLTILIYFHPSDIYLFVVRQNVKNRFPL